MNAPRSDLIRDVVLPFGFVIAPLSLAMALNIGPWLFAVTPVALAFGLFLNPTRIWPIWVDAIVVLWVGNAIIAIFDLVSSPPDAGDETVWGFMIESVLLMTVLVLLPAWVGRAAGRLLRGAGRHTRHEPSV